MSGKDKILSYLMEYLVLKVPNFKTETRGKNNLFTCPVCKTIPVSCNQIPNSSNIFCFKCNKKIGNLIDIVRIIEKDGCSDNEILEYLNNLLKLNIILEKDIDDILIFYEELGFDLVPIARNQKIPIEKDWTNKKHKDKKEWKNWLDDGINIGVKTGKASNCTVIDIDQNKIPQEILTIIEPLPVLTQKTKKGWHLIFKYSEDLSSTRIDELKIDILNNGKQFVVFPSTVEGEERRFNNENITYGYQLIEIPKELKEFLSKKITIPNLKTFSERLKEDIKTENFDLKIIDEGSRTNFLMHLGGILRKELNLSQTDYTINIVNKHFCKPLLPQKEVDNITKSLDKYVTFDEQELALKVLQYIKIVEVANSRDIREQMEARTGESKQRVERAIKYLVKEGFLYIKGKRTYHLAKKAEWRDTFVDEGNKIDYKMPYFDDYAIYRNGDMTVLGAKQKVGKSHIAMNMIKRFVDQGKKPNYVSLESGNRFVSIAKTLGLKEGDFNWCVHFAPEHIELEKNAITIIDWLLPDDYASTDKLYKHFAEQLVKNGGELIVFVQLKDDGEFFAKNMIPMFPSVIGKYLYDSDNDGTNGYFLLTYIREPRFKKKIAKIPCIYDWDSKLLTEVS